MTWYVTDILNMIFPPLTGFLKMSQGQEMYLKKCQELIYNVLGITIGKKYYSNKVYNK